MATSDSDVQQPAPKRRRVDQDYVRDADLWVEDGNIVIAATDANDPESTKGKTTYVFKCHRSLLSKQSKVFEGLLSIPPSAEAQDMYDGLPLVALPDTYADVKRVLQYLYEPGDIPLPGTHLWNVETACAVLAEIQGPVRFAAKYEFTKLHARLAKILECMWPTTLDEWDARSNWIEEHPLIWPARNSNFTPWAAHAIQLGYEGHVPSIIPVAFYILSTELPDLVDGVYSGAGVSAVSAHAAEQERMERSERLLGCFTSAQFAQLIIGRETMQSVATRLFTFVLPHVTKYARCDKLDNASDSDDNASDHEGPNPCAPGLQKWWNLRAETQRPVATSGVRVTHPDPLQILAKLDSFVMEESNFPNDDEICGACQFGISLAATSLRKYIWAELPYWFSTKSRDPSAVYGYKKYLSRDFRSVV